MANRVVADELRDACMSIALELGGWMDTSALKEGAQEQLAEECLSSLGELLESSPPLEQAVKI
jgi:hypothetical protein